MRGLRLLYYYLLTWMTFVVHIFLVTSGSPVLDNYESNEDVTVKFTMKCLVEKDPYGSMHSFIMTPKS
jgi:hypothetical protein